MKRLYKEIACHLKDCGRCKYSARHAPQTRTCFCEKIDEDASRERELLEWLMHDVRTRRPSVPRQPCPDGVHSQNEK